MLLRVCVCAGDDMRQYVKFLFTRKQQQDLSCLESKPNRNDLALAGPISC